MLKEKMEKFDKIMDFAKDNDVNVTDTEYQCYCAVKNCMKERGLIGLTDEEIGELVDMVDDIYLDTDDYCKCSIMEIADYLVKNYDEIDDFGEMDNKEILEDILDY